LPSRTATAATRGDQQPGVKREAGGQRNGANVRSSATAASSQIEAASAAAVEASSARSGTTSIHDQSGLPVPAHLDVEKLARGDRQVGVGDVAETADAGCGKRRIAGPAAAADGDHVHLGHPSGDGERLLAPDRVEGHGRAEGGPGGA
jgi:hypothetical protein